MLKTCEQIDRVEWDVDRVVCSAMSTLFRDEPDTRKFIKLNHRRQL